MKRPLPRLCLTLWAAASGAASASAFAQADRVVVDGAFDDWTDAEVVHADPFGDGPLGLDVGRVWAALEDGRLLLSIELAGEVGLQDGNALTLYLDADADASTGLAVHGVGAELAWVFGERGGTAYLDGDALPVRHADLGLLSAPTVTSDRFELALRFDASVGGRPIFRGDSLALVLRDGAAGDVAPDAPGGARFALEPRATPPLTVSLEREDPDHLRLATYNVLADGLFDPVREPHFRRVLRAVRPDVLALQEVYHHGAEQVAARLEALLPGEGGAWHVAGVGSDVFLASRYPIRRAEPLCAVATLPSTCNGAFLLDLRARYAEDLYVVVAHPPCCRNDAFRQEEVDLLMGHLRDARADGRLPGGTPFVVTGDLNLVGDARQLRTLLTGDIVDNGRFGPDFAPDWDGSDLADAAPPTTGVPAVFTWYSEAETFHPGRLDFVVFSDAATATGNTFALFTPALPPPVLDAHGLEPSDAVVASDHLPVVADLALQRPPTGADEGPARPGPLLGPPHPNPVAGRATVAYALPEPADVRVVVYDVLGRAVAVLVDGPAGAGRHEAVLEASALPAGTYLVRLEAGALRSTQRLTVAR